MIALLLCIVLDLLFWFDILSALIITTLVVVVFAKSKGNISSSVMRKQTKIEQCFEIGLDFRYIFGLTSRSFDFFSFLFFSICIFFYHFFLCSFLNRSGIYARGQPEWENEHRWLWSPLAKPYTIVCAKIVAFLDE